jgi:hypothetical protein
VEITVPVPGPETASGTVEITLTVGVIAPRDWRQITAAMSEGVEA